MTILRQQIIALLTIASLVLVIFSSLAMASHEPGGNMTNDCPFSSPGTSFCPQNLIAATIHHLSAYYSFFNVPLNLGLTMFVSLLLILYFVLISSISPPRFKSALLNSRLYTPLPVPLRDRKITHWLALLENSPAPL